MKLNQMTSKNTIDWKESFSKSIQIQTMQVGGCVGFRLNLCAEPWEQDKYPKLLNRNKKCSMEMLTRKMNIRF